MYFTEVTRQDFLYCVFLNEMNESYYFCLYISAAAQSFVTFFAT